MDRLEIRLAEGLERLDEVETTVEQLNDCSTQPAAETTYDA